MAEETKWAVDIWSHLTSQERERIGYEGADEWRADLEAQCVADVDVDRVLVELERLAGYDRMQ